MDSNTYKRTSGQKTQRQNILESEMIDLNLNYGKRGKYQQLDDDERKIFQKSDSFSSLDYEMIDFVVECRPPEIQGQIQGQNNETKTVKKPPIYSNGKFYDNLDLKINFNYKDNPLCKGVDSGLRLFLVKKFLYNLLPNPNEQQQKAIILGQSGRSGQVSDQHGQSFSKLIEHCRVLELNIFKNSVSKNDYYHKLGGRINKMLVMIDKKVGERMGDGMVEDD